MIADTRNLKEGSRIVAWDGDYKRYFAISVTKLHASGCQGIDASFKKHTGLKYKHCWWPEDFRIEKPEEYARLFPRAVASTVSGTVNTPDVAPPPPANDTKILGGKPEAWNPKHFGECPRKAEESGQLTIFWDNTGEPPEPEDYPDLDSYEKAWAEWEAKASLEGEEEKDTHISPKEIWEQAIRRAKCGSSICAVESEQVSHSPEEFLGDSSLSDCAIATNTVNQFSGSDIPACESTPTCAASPMRKLGKSAIAEPPLATPSIQESPQSPCEESSISIPSSPKNQEGEAVDNSSPKKFLGENPSPKKASGWLEKYLENKKLKSGIIATYPRVEGNRDPDVIEHWYWNYRYEEKSAKAKSANKHITRAIRVPHHKVEAVLLATKKFKWPVEKVLQYLRGEL